MSIVARVANVCRVCGFQKLTPIISLGDLYVSNFIEDSQIDQAEKVPLELILCNVQEGGCGLVQLKHTVSSELMYRNYWYHSGINKSMTDELSNITMEIKKIVDLSVGDFVIDIGSNDGTMLRNYKIPGLNLVGFEPARNLEEPGQNGITKIIVDFFNLSAWKKEFGDARAKVITAIAMFYDLDDPNAFVRDVAELLDDEGLFVIQMMYLPSFLARNAFDGICHEHLEYYSLLPLENLLKRHDLEVFDVKKREHINEGSFRVYVRKVGCGRSLRVQDGAAGRVSKMRQDESQMGLGDKKIYDDFAYRVQTIKKEVVDFISEQVLVGKKIYAYAASTKGNTLLQFFGLNSSLVAAIADKNRDKWGKKTVGTMIPIISEEQFRAANPDYALILAWHFLPEFIKRETYYLRGGGKFIVPLPEFEVISASEL